jgi:hypothetical protein
MVRTFLKLMVRTFLKVYMKLGSYFLFLQEQIKDIIIIVIHAFQFMQLPLRPDELGDHRR